jgi:hypothetical protein
MRGRASSRGVYEYRNTLARSTKYENQKFSEIDKLFCELHKYCI